MLYSEQPSPPNVPISTLVGAELLTAGSGRSDEELYDQIQFNVQVRYSLGLRDLRVVPFELRVSYNFRQRRSEHTRDTGENLLEAVFVQVTDEQLAALNLKARRQRKDSVQYLDRPRPRAQEIQAARARR